MPLYIVATPIGNTADISSRAVSVLGAVDFIYAEDSRNTNNLLRILGIGKSSRSYHHHSGKHKEDEILYHLENGKDIAIVTDSGTPGISDPGNRLIARVWEEKRSGLEVDIVPVPGASAATTILSVSGFITDDFYFLGFLPKKKGRQKRLEEIAGYNTVLVIYESPYRIVKTLEELGRYFGDVESVVGRELTKKFEEIKRGSLNEMASYYKSKSVKGEFVVVINNRKK